MQCHKAQYNPSTNHHSFFIFKCKQPPTPPPTMNVHIQHSKNETSICGDQKKKHYE